MCSMLSSQGVALATVMAVSGTVILLAFRLQKSSLAALFPVDEITHSSPQIPRSCISSEGVKKNRKKNKRVRFAKDVKDPSGDGEAYRRQRSTSVICNSAHSNPQRKVKKNQKGGEGVTAAAAAGEIKGLPANRLALYNGILRDRVVHRLAYSY